MKKRITDCSFIGRNRKFSKTKNAESTSIVSIRLVLSLLLFVGSLIGIPNSVSFAKPTCSNLQKAQITKFQQLAFQTKTFLKRAETDYAKAKIKYSQSLAAGGQSSASKAKIEMESAQSRIDNFKRNLNEFDRQVRAITDKCDSKSTSSSPVGGKKCSEIENATLKTIVLQYQVQQDTKRLLNGFIKESQIDAQNFFISPSKRAQAQLDSSRYIGEYQTALSQEILLKRQYDEVVSGCLDPAFVLPPSFEGNWNSVSVCSCEARKCKQYIYGFADQNGKKATIFVEKPNSLQKFTTYTSNCGRVDSTGLLANYFIKTPTICAIARKNGGSWIGTNGKDATPTFRFNTFEIDNWEKGLKSVGRGDQTEGPVLVGLNEGNCEFEVTQPGDNNYEPYSVILSVEVRKQGQGLRASFSPSGENQRGYFASANPFGVRSADGRSSLDPCSLCNWTFYVNPSKSPIYGFSPYKFYADAISEGRFPIKIDNQTPEICRFTFTSATPAESNNPYNSITGNLDLLKAGLCKASIRVDGDNKFAPDILEFNIDVKDRG